jgi:hypothetical protein
MKRYILRRVNDNETPRNKISKHEEILCSECSSLSCDKMKECACCSTKKNFVYCDECINTCVYCEKTLCDDHAIVSTWDKEDFLCQDCVAKHTCFSCYEVSNYLYPTCCNGRICEKCDTKRCQICHIALCDNCACFGNKLECCNGRLCSGCSEWKFTCAICDEHFRDKVYKQLNTCKSFHDITIEISKCTN